MSKQVAMRPHDVEIDPLSERDLFNCAPEAFLLVDELLRIVKVNPAAEELFKRSQKELSGSPVSKLIPDLLLDGNLRSVVRRPYLPKSWDNEMQLGCCHRLLSGSQKDGQTFALEAAVTTLRVDERTFHLILCHRAPMQVAADYDQWLSVQRNQAIYSLAPIGIFQLNAHWECVYVNDYWCRLAGLNGDEACRHGWLTAIHITDRQKVAEEIRNAFTSRVEFKTECRFQSPLGDVRWVMLRICPMRSPDGSNLGFMGTVQDIDDLVKTKETLEYMAQFDHLTGLPNRRLFMDRLDQAIIRSSRTSSLALLFIDLDEFKKLNDTLGHEFGDELLKMAAQRMEATVRREDTVARLAGDEFMVIIERAERVEHASVVAEKILAALRQPFIVHDHEILIAATIGVSMTQDAHCPAEVLIKQADTAMYRAKQAGRNQYHIYSDELSAEAAKRDLIEQAVKNALARGELSLEYQAQLDTETGEVLGHEALMRWRNPELGAVGPDHFIPAMERSGLIHEATRWLVKEAVRWQAARWHAGKKDEVISVNLSAKQLHDESFVSFVAEVLRDNDLPASALALEITETAVMNSPMQARKVLLGLRQMGAGIALDDFGTGYSSLTYLKKFPVTTLKIDRTFVHGLDREGDDAIIVQSIIDLGKNMRMHVVAEGVETPEQLSFLKKHGCDAWQGWLSRQ